MRLHELAHELDVVGIGNLEQHDRQVTGDRVAPEAGLPPTVSHQHARGGPQRGVGKDHRACEASVELRIGLGGVELPQHDLAVRGRQLEHAIRETAILVLVDEMEHGVPRLGSARNHVDRRRGSGVDGEAMADRDDRIQHRTLGARQRTGERHRDGFRHASAAPDESPAVGLARNLAGLCAVRGHQMEHPRHLLLEGARPTGAKNGASPRDDLGLDEQVAECRMQRVRGRRREDHLGIARHVQRPRGPRPIGDVDPAELDVVFRRNHDLGMRLEIEILASKLRPALREDRFVAIRLLPRRLVCRRPELAACLVAQIAEGAPIVGRGVFAPPGHGQVFPATAAASGIRDHDVVAAVRQQVHLRDRGVRTGQHAHRQLRTGPCNAHGGDIGGMRMKQRGSRDALLKQKQCGLKERVRLEARLHRSPQQHVGVGKQTHALVVCHVRSDHRARFPATLPRRRVVDGLEQAQVAGQPAAGETLQVEARRFRSHHQREGRRVGRNHQIRGESAFQAQPGNPEGAVLVIGVDIDRVVAALRHPPGNTALPPILDLSLHRGHIRLIEQRVLVGRHHQERHEVLEHRAAPRQQDRLSAGRGEQPPQREPAFLRQLALRNGDEIAQSRLRCEQVVIARVAAEFLDVEADHQLATHLVEQEVVIHLGQRPRLHHEPVERDHSCRCALRTQRNQTLQSAVRIAPFGRRSGFARVFGHPRRRCAERRNFAQRGDAVRARKTGTCSARARELQPRRERDQVITNVRALRRQRPGPEGGVGPGVGGTAGGEVREHLGRALPSPPAPAPTRPRGLRVGNAPPLPATFPIARRRAAGAVPTVSVRIENASRAPSSQRGLRMGASPSAVRPGRNVSRCPARLPLSTVETYRGARGSRVSVSYQL